MTDYTERGAVPVDDAVASDPPTVDEVLAEQERRETANDPSPDASEEAPPSQADPGYDLPGDNPLASLDDDD